MVKDKNKIDPATKDLAPDASDAPPSDLEAELAELTDKWKRAMADAENARKRANAAHQDGREHGVALAVGAFAPVFDDISLAIQAAHADPDVDSPRIVALLAGLNSIKTAFEAALKALGVRQIAPLNTPFDPVLHEATQLEETDEAKPGEVLVLHRPGFALGQRLIRPAHVTVSASPSKPSKD